MPTNLYQRAEQALLDPDPESKCAQVSALYDDWQSGQLHCEVYLPILPVDDPGRPPKPQLVDPRKLSRRSVASEQGRIHLLHAFAHIEFTAINIALDAVYRFRDMPRQYIGDWLLVASEEAKHFSLLETSLRDRGSFYGDCAAHSGLWDMVCKTRGDVLHRMALVPRVMEARGLDVTPSMIERFQQVGDSEAVKILRIIYADEIGHVRIGNHWYQTLCEQRQLDPVATFQSLIAEYLGGQLRGPFNWPARLEAGFEEAELEALERCL
jgi:uncharacterized ferritin-like protein (DUF455 family)